MKSWVVIFIMVGALLGAPTFCLSDSNVQNDNYLFTELADIKAHPAAYYGKKVQVWCHFDRVSAMWADLLPDSKDIIGFYAFIPANKFLSKKKKYFNLMFAKRSQLELLSTLRLDQKITVYGKCVRFESPVFISAGIRIDEIALGWQEGMAKVAVSYPKNTGAYNIMVNGVTYQDLIFGELYEKEGVKFAVIRGDIPAIDGDEIKENKQADLRDDWENSLKISDQKK